MSNEALKTKRLQKQQISFEKQPMQHAFVKRDGQLNFYFCLYNLDDDFKNGFYFGLFQLHPNYPFAAPKLYFYTPNGRYDVNMAICTSFTNYHPQSWQASWNVRSLIQGTISFMYSNEASYGCRHDNSQDRKNHAKESLKWNMNNQLFVRLFGKMIRQKLSDLIKSGIQIYEQNLLNQYKKTQKQSNLLALNIKQQTFTKQQTANNQEQNVNIFSRRTDKDSTKYAFTKNQLQDNLLMVQNLNDTINDENIKINTDKQRDDIHRFNNQQNKPDNNRHQIIKKTIKGIVIIGALIGIVYGVVKIFK